MCRLRQSPRYPRPTRSAAGRSCPAGSRRAGPQRRGGRHRREHARLVKAIRAILGGGVAGQVTVFPDKLEENLLVRCRSHHLNTWLDRRFFCLFQPKGLTGHRPVRTCRVVLLDQYYLYGTPVSAIVFHESTPVSAIVWPYEVPLFQRWKTIKTTGFCGKPTAAVAETPQERRPRAGRPDRGKTPHTGNSRPAGLFVDEPEWCRWDARRRGREDERARDRLIVQAGPRALNFF